jgi:hypothetical protein
MKKILFSAIVLISISMLTITSCVKQKFDAPPDASNIDPNLTVNSNIWYLKNTLYTGQPTLIDTDLTISGIVIADDRSGNFYKQIVIQDTSSGIAVLLGRNSLYTDYPIGRKIYIKCKGLYIGEYNGFVQLGYLPDNSNSLSDIPTNLITKYVVKANYPNVVTPRIVSIPEILTVNATNKKWIGTLLQLDSVEIALNEVGTPYADDASISSGSNRTIIDCAKEKLILRNSGYSSFRNYLLPSGKGPLTAVFSVFGKDAQFLIRDTNDLKLYGPRCTSNANLVTIRSIRNLFTGSVVTVPPNTKIRGVVISDKNGKNINDKNIVIQDATAGVVVRFNLNSGLPSLGDEVEVTISGGTVSEFSGVLQVGGISNSEYMKLGLGTIIPKISTLRQINDSSEAWESTLVKVMGATYTSGTGNYGGFDNIIDDGTASITHYVASAATFAAVPYALVPKNYTAIVGQFNEKKQISIRNLNDVE